jgi:hypothetical protein
LGGNRAPQSIGDRMKLVVRFGCGPKPSHYPTTSARLGHRGRRPGLQGRAPAPSHCWRLVQRGGSWPGVLLSLPATPDKLCPVSG